MDIVSEIRALLNEFKLRDDGLETAGKGKIRETQKLNKQKLLERYKGADEKLAGETARNKNEIDELLAELTKERKLKDPNFFYVLRLKSLMQLRTIYYYQLQLLKLQSKLEK